ncbi:hypothetical protein F66182_7037 [Fusarium sp. NRRL 66182]|nr:hypothetical protein F66182_7037 [Fusarium sp. NRRL 66182]
MASTAESPPTLVIGIDFGTTFSGVAWSRAGSKRQTKIVTDWPTSKGYPCDKDMVPSAILYSHLNDESPAWGYATPLEETVMRWFKLLLVDEKDLPEWVRGSPQVSTVRALMQKANKTPIQVLGDYLRRVWDHSHGNIQRSVGQRMMKLSRVHVVVTLPAIWPQYARERMTKALEHAGLLEVTRGEKTSVGFISEPEAAALMCLEENSDRPDVKVGDHFIVCNAGGGTVDIITYKVEKLHPLTVSESVKGDGALCGAIFLDEKFLALLKSTIPLDVQKKLQKPGLQKIMDDDWEVGIKPSVCKQSASWDIQLAYNGPVSSQFPSKINIDGSTVRRKVYQPVIAKIQGLVSKQINQFIILVGGFGKSRLLYECLRETVGSKMEVLQENGPGPWTAVLRGVVLHGLARTGLTDSISVAVQSRISRHSYGTLVNILPFDADEHDPKDRVYCQEHQEFLAVEQTKWFVRIGESVSTHDPFASGFWQDLSSIDQDIQVDIVISDSPEAPARKDNSVRSLGVIKTSELPVEVWTDLPVWTNKDGEVFRRINYELRIVSDGSSLEFAIWYKRIRLASESVVFDSAEEQEDDHVASAEASRQLLAESGPEIIGIDSDSDYVDE